MAIPKHAQVVASEQLGPDTRLVELAPREPLEFVGGQYVIVDTGLVADSGKAIKRAYSLLSGDAEAGRFQLAVKRIAGGPGSGFVHEIEVGAELRFSGPWGKFQPRGAAGDRTLILATDTGITAALGLVRSARFEPLLAGAVLVWLRQAPDYFLPDTFVRDRVPSSCGELRIEPMPPVGHPERLAHARAVLADALGRMSVAQGFLAGDGAVNYALLDDLCAAGVPATKDHVESFFNARKKSA